MRDVYDDTCALNYENIHISSNAENAFIFDELLKKITTSFLTLYAFCRPGGYGKVAAPVPIPNTAVKRLSADGTLS